MFEGEPHRSYRGLMRELRLPREPIDGDWFDDGEEPVLFHRYYCNEYGPYEWEDFAWLPSLADWLLMLEAEGIDSVQFFQTDGGHVVARTWERNGVMRRDPWVGDTRTHEESAARLFLSVTGRTVTSG